MLRAATLAVLSLLAALVVGCGGSGASGHADPASVVPADAMLYAQATIKPQDGTREDALAAAAKVLRTDDPEGKIHELLDKALAKEKSSGLDYDKDIKPWLGDRVGVWFSTQLDPNNDPRGAVVVAVSDQDAAMAAMRKGAANSGDKLTGRTYGGADYVVDQDGVACGPVGDDFIAVGPEPQYKQTVDASKGRSLAEDDRYAKGLDKLDDNRLAHFYVDLRRLFTLIARTEPQQGLDQLRSVIPFDRLGPLVGSFQANGDRLALDASASVQGGALGAFGGLPTSGSTTPLVADLPGDSWAAFGAANYGRTIKAALGQYAGVLGGEAMRQQLKNQLGIDIDEDVLSWVGDVAVFVRGETVQRLDGGVVIEVTDKAKAARGFGKLVGLVQTAGQAKVRPVSVAGAESAFAIQDGSMPKPVVLARSADRVVATYGLDAARAALKPSSKLGDSDTWQAAKDALGDSVEPSLVVAMAPILSLVDSSGSADADYAKAKPYLEAYDVFALGSKSSGSGGLVRFAAGLK